MYRWAETTLLLSVNIATDNSPAIPSGKNRLLSFMVAYSAAAVSKVRASSGMVLFTTRSLSKPRRPKIARNDWYAARVIVRKIFGLNTW